MLNLNNSQVFQSLPGYVKENILQSGIDFQDEAHLKEFANNLEKEYQQFSSKFKGQTLQ